MVAQQSRNPRQVHRLGGRPEGYPRPVLQSQGGRTSLAGHPRASRCPLPWTDATVSVGLAARQRKGTSVRHTGKKV
eukprot:3863377-Rhodomonas_salina.7